MHSELPKPFESPLWKHIKQIDFLVDSGKSWAQISQALLDEHEIKITKQACCNFYQRFHRRKKFPWRVAKFMTPEKKFKIGVVSKPEIEVQHSTD